MKKIILKCIVIKQQEFPPYCVPIQCDILKFKFESLINNGGFNVILLDPPWVMTPTKRGVCSFSY